MTPMVQLMDKIAGTVLQMNGWCSVDKAQALAAMVVALRPKRIVEVGVYAGRSVVPMAMALAFNGSGEIYAIDAWDASIAKRNEVKDHADWWSKIDFDAIYNEFVSTVDKNQLSAFVKIIKGESSKVEPPTNIDILTVDGAHTDQAIEDVERFAPNVRKGGLVIMDDIGWVGGGVQRACDVLVDDLGFIKLWEYKAGDDFWGVFQKLDGSDSYKQTQW